MSEDRTRSGSAAGTAGQAGNPAFAAKFAPASREQWLKHVRDVLKGAPFERLIAKSYDGIAIEPLYARAAAAAPVFGREAGAGAPWQVMQRINHPDLAVANAQARHDLDHGAAGLALVLAGSPGAHGFGLPSDGEAPAFDRALAGIRLDGGAGAALDLDGGPQGEHAAAALADIVKTRGVAPDTTHIRFGIDPLGAAAIGAGPTAVGPLFAATVQNLAAQGYGGPFAAADGRVIHNAGGSEAQELAYVLAAAVAYLRALEAAGVALDDARRMTFFRLSADSDQFLTMAKFRALRLLWARVEDACGLAPRPAFIAAETAWRMMTRRAPFVNMLRATVAVFAAGLGGADSVTVLPHTAAIGLPDAFARRIARNTQLILIEEANLAEVADPAAGSGAVEALTGELCRSAWPLFQAIERAGGAAAALERGLIQDWVAVMRREREAAVARGTDAITGVSTFAELGETAPAVLAVAPAVTPPAASSVPPRPAVLSCCRLAEPFEALRDASDRTLERTGARPNIFLAKLGRPVDFTEPAAFAKNLFEAGGIEAVSNDAVSIDGAATTTVIAAFKASGASLACLCASPALYAEQAADIAAALRAAGARHVYLVGRPARRSGAGAADRANGADGRAGARAEGRAEEPDAAGVGTFVHAGCDALEILRSAHAAAGVS
jgi:methylmalonyl-CoA mutase